MKKNTPSKIDHLLEHVVAAVKKAESKEDALKKCIDEVCTRLKWPIGHVYFPAKNNPTRLDSSKLWFFDKPDQYEVFRDITEDTPFDIGAGLPGRVLKTKKPEWIPDVTKDTNFPRANRAENIGVKAAFAFPVILHSEVVAVLEFFSPLAIEPDEQILAVMENIGKQVGEAIFEAQLRKSKQMQQAVASREEKLRNSIRPEKLDDYIKWIETIWKEVLRLNSYIHCIKRITEFPFGLLQHNPSPFWTCVVDSMFESSITLIYKIWIDDDDRTLTLERFKDEIVCRFIKEEYKKQLIEDWDVQFKKIDPNIKKRIEDLRNNIVHFNLNRALNIDVSDEDIKKREIFLTEIYELIENIESLFFVLNLGHIFRRTDHGTDLYDLNYPLADAKDPSDIEILLDTIAKKSEIMNMPEEDPEYWAVYREEIVNDSKIEIFNKYRKKFQLPQA